MKIDRRAFIAASFAAPLGVSASTTANHTFGVDGDHFTLDGKPFRILSGEMHYPRVPRPCWQDRMRKARALGLNAITTYLFWNAHEPRPGEWNFGGNLDVAAYVRAAQQEGLWVILRPGPYVCAEWDFGGLPAWLMQMPDLKVRTRDPRFLSAASKYLKRVGQELAPLQITRGGSIILCQVENEYGSFGDDHAYMDAIRKAILDAGFDVTLYTADGSEMLNKGALPGLPAAINFGADSNAADEFGRLQRFRATGPRMCGEFWDGWFDHWGEVHHTVDAEVVAKPLDWMLSGNISVSFYMFHGGTTFGFMAGANQGRAYEPDISAYDYDGLLDEAGNPTRKFYAVRDIIRKHSPGAPALPALPAPEPSIAIPRFELRECAALDTLRGSAVESDRPRTMDELGQFHGLVLYETRVAGGGAGWLELEAHDYAIVSAAGRQIGVIDRRLGQSKMEVELPAGQTLEIVVDAMGRMNFGRFLGLDRKGLTGPVRLNGAELPGWRQYRIPLDDLKRLQFARKPVSAPAFYRAEVSLSRLGYTFLDMRGWSKGYVWVNGHNLGRYWSAGPQRSLYVPAEWLRGGSNEVIVLDLHDGSARTLESRTMPIYDTLSRHA